MERDHLSRSLRLDHVRALGPAQPQPVAVPEVFWQRGRAALVVPHEQLVAGPGRRRRNSSCPAIDVRIIVDGLSASADLHAGAQSRFQPLAFGQVVPSSNLMHEMMPGCQTPL